MAESENQGEDHTSSDIHPEDRVQVRAVARNVAGGEEENEQRSKDRIGGGRERKLSAS